MSNIKKKNKYRKSENMSLRLTERQKEKIENSAKRNNMSASEFVVKKATEDGRLHTSREYERIYRLVKTEETLGKLLRKIQATNPEKDILDELNNLGEEINELWLC